MPTTEITKRIVKLQHEIRSLRSALVVHDPNPATTAKVAQDLHVHPGSTRADVARRLGLHAKSIGRAMDVLVRRGLGVRVGIHRGTRWYLTSTARALTSAEH